MLHCARGCARTDGSVVYPHTTCSVVCSCRFLKPGGTLPADMPAPFSKKSASVGTKPTQDLFYYIYNATCMLEERKRQIAAFEKPKSGLVRPAIGAPAPNATQPLDFEKSLRDTFTFFKLMWAGVSEKVQWRDIGFAKLDPDCDWPSYNTSFATGGAPLHALSRHAAQFVCAHDRGSMAALQHLQHIAHLFYA